MPGKEDRRECAMASGCLGRSDRVLIRFSTSCNESLEVCNDIGADVVDASDAEIDE